MALRRLQAHRDSTTDAYEDYAHTGPGTLAGRFMRTFWQPVHRADDLPPGHAKPIRIMSEDFTLYRGEDGTPHLVAPRCAHRGTQLSTGWVEGDCIRCFYHGWKYDGSGQCVEQPAEDASFASKVRIRSYPCEEYLGLVFAYLGDAERGDTGAFRPPPLPRYPEFEREGALDVATADLPWNYFNGVENSVDIVHVSFVHSHSGFSEGGLSGIPTPYAEETDSGILMHDAYPNGEVRTTMFEMPTLIHFKLFPHEPGGPWRDFVSWKVPLDDEHFHSFLIIHTPMTAEEARRYEANPDRHKGFVADEEDRALAQTVLAGEARLRVDEVGPRAARVSVQDFVAQRGQGVIADREHERLGRSDVSVILLRKIWRRERQALDEGKPLTRWRWSGDVVLTSGA